MNTYAIPKKTHFISVLFFILLAQPIVAEDDAINTQTQALTEVSLSSYADTNEAAHFYGNKLSDNNILGGYGGFTVSLENDSANIAAFVEVGGGVQIKIHHLLKDDSYSFVNFGCRYFY